MVIKNSKADCIEGAIFAAAVLEFHGQKPLVVDLRSIKKPYDYDHVVAVFQKGGFWGAISKTNHSVLRYREPIYRDIRELVMSYFHEYFLDSGVKRSTPEVTALPAVPAPCAIPKIIFSTVAAVSASHFHQRPDERFSSSRIQNVLCYRFYSFPPVSSSPIPFEHVRSVRLVQP
jgi:hypothetical protein